MASGSNIASVGLNRGLALQSSSTATRSSEVHAFPTDRLARCALGQSLPQPWRREIKESSQLERQKSLTGKDETDGPGRRLEFWKRNRKRARPNRGCDLIGEHTGDSQTCDRCVDRGFGGVDGESRMDFD